MRTKDDGVGNRHTQKKRTLARANGDSAKHVPAGSSTARDKQETNTPDTLDNKRSLTADELQIVHK